MENMDSRYDFVRGGRFLNGTTFSKTMNSYQCGSCVKLFTYEMLVQQLGAPEAVAYGNESIDRVWLCPHFNCKKPVARGDIDI